ncbi:Y-family DNA polymerase [Tellurirhabdus bombi]|uniref:Y-family DNA polymerase n=1 Tax=Tellurirhabdus bombi TaxID=2907205 RepID=UPI001F322E25|nr:Y-family DNA polymerase [Tellurirhabdus bombi]
MIAIADANNFYVSCERAFNPTLEKKPVVIMSNNDLCVIARSNEAKALGIKMGQPYFQAEEFIKAHDIQVFSSNYVLYGDMSARVMSTLAHFVEDVEVSSIDEAFLDLTSCPGNPDDIGRQLKATVSQWTRIPLSIGIAPTKTLAKVANWYAKKAPESGGVLTFQDPDQINSALKNFEVDNLWGIGRRYATLLKKNHIHTAWDLSQVHDLWIEKHMTVNGLRLVHELRGLPCHPLEVEPTAKRVICVAPSFGQLIHDLPTIQMGLMNHLAQASRKLRAQNSAASSLTVFLHTNRYRTNAKYYSNSRFVQLPHPSGSLSELAKYASAALEAIFRFGYAYQKVGIYLTGLVPLHYQQPSIFTEGPDPRHAKLSQAMDQLNHRFGRDKVRLAAQGYEERWQMKQRWLSRCYTTRWSDILEAM